MAAAQDLLKASARRKISSGKLPKASSKPSRGVCRVCFEDESEEELLAPCNCSGTSKWIHRSCLNQWRVSRANPRAFTHCCECNFQYELDLQRIHDPEEDTRRRHAAMQIILHPVIWFFGVQMAIIALAMVIKLMDKTAVLVRWFPFEKVAKVAGYFPTLQHYALTYYVAGLLAFVLIFGVFAVCTFCCGRYGFSAPREECAQCFEGVDLCWTQAPYYCHDCNLVLLGADVLCQASCSHSMLALFVFLGSCLVAGIFVIGFMAVVCTLVVICQRVVQNYVRWREMGLIAEEYVVRDLATPRREEEGAAAQQDMERGAATPRTGGQPQASDLSQSEIQQRVEDELQAVFGGSLPGPLSAVSKSNASARGYGSTGAASGG